MSEKYKKVGHIYGVVLENAAGETRLFSLTCGDELLGTWAWENARPVKLLKGPTEDAIMLLDAPNPVFPLTVKG